MEAAYIQNDPLYQQITEKHTFFLDADESEKKCRLRDELEILIAHYLCFTPHCNKFRLPTTEKVLKRSIKEMKDFSPYKASIGFEAISLYANNLFRKPWQKEYTVIKTYSGYFKHEVLSNLLDAEALFHEMGYKRMPNQTLALDGPICPDRVTNVSRDAITANVECQIMKEIYSELIKKYSDVSWSDIYDFRERYTLDVKSTVDEMTKIIEGKCLKPQQTLRQEFGNPLEQNVSMCSSCNSHPFHYPPQTTVTPLPTMMFQIPLYSPLYNASPCSAHSQFPKIVCGFPSHHNSQSYQQSLPSQSLPHPANQPSVIPLHPPPLLGSIPHSKSLEHYHDTGSALRNLQFCMQRHSLDPPYDYPTQTSHYGGPMGMGISTGAYDNVDNCGMQYDNHPYNVSGNRFPLPVNLLNNFTPFMNNTRPKPNGSEIYHQHNINDYPQTGDHYHHQRSYSNGQNYDQHPQSHRLSADPYMNHSFEHACQQTQPSILSKKKTSYEDCDVALMRLSAEDKRTAELIYTDTNDETNKNRKKPDRNLRSTNLPGDFESKMLPETLQERQKQHHYLHHQISHNSRQSDFDSFEDEQLQAEANQMANNVSKRISSKNQDGIGSYGSWNYVFQNLEKQGYSKDLGERGDFFADDDAEDFLEANTSRGSTIKRNNERLKPIKIKSADKIDGIRNHSARQCQISEAKHDRENERNEMAVRACQKSSSVQKTSKSNSNNITDNSSYKANQIGGGSMNGAVTNRRNSITRKTSVSTKENCTTNNATSSSSTSGGILVNHNCSISSMGKKKTASFDTAAATIINPQDDMSRKNPEMSSGEWNCKYCTFLNPNTVRICEMCAKSRELDSTSGTTNTATSNGTTTCV